MAEIIRERGLSNEDFFARHAGVGRVGLVGGNTWVDRIIARAERHLHPEHQWSRWTHAFLLQGLRPDGHQWVIESERGIDSAGRCAMLVRVRDCQGPRVLC